VLSAKFPWAKSIVDAHEKEHQVRCKVCTKIERKEKLLDPKLSSLHKHGGRRKTLFTIPRVCKDGE
jgi:hypothetical protein